MRRDDDLVELGFELLQPGTINLTRKSAQGRREIGLITSQPPPMERIKAWGCEAACPKSNGKPIGEEKTEPKPSESVPTLTG